ncbi:hypothetical protein PR202_ga27406 [Eleusine coracana subsp. coracana]|uniref:DUF3615 domain-containing protein n=1 Tax=Eleusine coracana subsp. coracana TaxID=191504 RepID=A0AAV5DEQ3_ELECO|nr:hypothetical protein PR202_ga27406 [Eleusine coracana subsp. coracana]
MDRYFHINFMACPNGDDDATRPPVRFFAEAHSPPAKNCSQDDITLCCMLVESPSHVGNCYACVTNNHEIDHPNAEEHFGSHPYKMDEAEKHRCCPSTVVDVDYRFFDPVRDVDLMEQYAEKISFVEAVRAKFRAERKDRFKTDGSTTKPKYHHIFAEDDSGDEEDENASDEDISIYCTRCI